MLETVEPLIPRTTADMVFERLHEDILTLKLLPGPRISEADVASRLGVSRQPVRDAFNRLGNLNLLKIRPQRATEVCGFSWTQIENARFIRMAVELEVARTACLKWDTKSANALESNLAEQRTAIEMGLITQFHNLDYDFHQLICTVAGHPLAFETVKRCKQQVDRLCVLSLARSEEVSAVLVDHEEIAQAFETGIVANVESIFRRHLGRLDDAIKDIHDKHAEFFE